MATGQSKKRDKKSYHKKTTSPKMPKEKETSNTKDATFKPGQGTKWSAPVGKRRNRKATANKAERNRAMLDNYGAGVGSSALKIQKQKDVGRAADTKGITNIGKK